MLLKLTRKWRRVQKHMGDAGRASDIRPVISVPKTLAD
jgi:hypothetical protein